MINAIIEAIRSSLTVEFDEKEYEIYSEKTEQDFNKPCFFITCLKPTHAQFLGKKYFKQNPFVIQYFPESADVQQECNAVAERMNWCLEYIAVGDENKQIRGTKMNYEIVDDVLNFFVNYDCYVYKEETETTMETLNKSINL